MAQEETRIVGYFAHLSATDVLCTDVDACLISGSREAMERYLAEMAHDARKATIKKTRFGEVLRGLQLGAAYAFDREAYERFRPLALHAGVPVAEADFAAQERRGGRFFTVRLVVK